MRVMLWRNKAKVKPEDPDYIVLQRQRLNDGTTAYITVEVGFAYKQEAPDGETYVDINLPKFGTNNRPTPLNPVIQPEEVAKWRHEDADVGDRAER
jgi:hypothetical protein